MATFKDQDNVQIKESCSKNEYELVIVPHNLINKFQPLDNTINQKAKSLSPIGSTHGTEIVSVIS